ncbi:sterol desaturase family protein [Thalassoroseus pseudoceratinae]|uniref:sterol desaturase family protein n=1 Tax=Thalassoroseus pseudoceratinae TaxID=2713176 RepID=UPI001422A148|nr:sterol desaturase family protein [Thalassoroseus pseudoceratinae]
MMTQSEFTEFGIAFGIALVFASLVEYVVHRWMHGRGFLSKKHARHHQDGDGQGWFFEFCDYTLGSLPILWFGFLYSIPAGLGYAIGGILYAALSAYAHQLQHEYPEMVFWMPRPVHYLHHHHKMWRHNFGILVDIWDRIFGTYKPVEPTDDTSLPNRTLSKLIRIRWF